MSLKLHLRTGERFWREFFAAGAFFLLQGEKLED